METDNGPQGLPWHACELLVAFKCTELGYSVSVPLSPQGYDLVVDTKQTPPRLVRVQVKRARHQQERLRRAGKGDLPCYRVTLLRQKRYPLRVDEFDFLVVVCEPALIYVLPMAVLLRGGRMVKYLQIKPTAVPTRADSQRAVEQWKPWLNRFTALAEPV